MDGRLNDRDTKPMSPVHMINNADGNRWGAPGEPSVVKVMEAVCRSVGSARLTEAQQRSLDWLCAEVKQLCALGREADARRRLKLALSLVSGGPPAGE